MKTKTLGSLLLSALFHFQMMNPIFPDAQPWDTLMLLIAAAVIVWLNRQTLFLKGNGVIEVLMPSSSLAASERMHDPNATRPFGV